MEVRAAALQADGRLLVAGRFDLVGGRPNSSVGRLDARGMVDAGFTPWPCVQGRVNAVALQADGKILLGGEFNRVGGERRWGVARLHADGTLDQQFAPIVEGGLPAVIAVVRVQADGRILIGGEFRTVAHQPRRGIARLLSDGELDAEFAPGQGAEDSFGSVSDLVLRPDGGVIVAGCFTKFDGWARAGLVELDARGQVSSGFAPALDWSAGLAAVQVAQRQPDGGLLIAGRFDRIGAAVRTGLARLHPSGELDEGFEFGAAWTSDSEDPVRALAVQPDGRILVAGAFTAIGESVRRGIARLEPTGAVDETFDAGAGLAWLDGRSAVANAVVVQPEQGIVVVGDFDRAGGEPRHRIVRLRPDGQVDADFAGPAMIVERVGTVNAVLVQRDGQLVVGGDFERANGEARRALARFGPAGHLDAGFMAGLDAEAMVGALAEQRDGRLVIGGRFSRVHGQERPNLARLQKDGGVDPSFDPGNGPDGEVYCIALDPDDRIVFSGDFEIVDTTPRRRIARLDRHGSVDLQFGPRLGAAVDTPDVYSIVPEADGRLLIGGYFDWVDGQPRTTVARLLADGRHDPEFGQGLEIGGDLPLVTSMARDGLGRLTIGGTFASVNGQSRGGIARLTPSGQLDASFDPGAGLTGGELPAINALALDAAGRVVIAGEFTAFDQTARNNLARLQPDGKPDATFAAGGCTDWWALAVGIQADGAVVVGGAFTTIAGKPRQGIARFKPGTDPFPAVTIHLDRGKAAIAWEGSGTLQSSASLFGPWLNEPDSWSPVSSPPNGPTRFYRLLR